MSVFIHLLLRMMKQKIHEITIVTKNSIIASIRKFWRAFNVNSGSKTFLIIGNNTKI